jgi:hypothetical protein
MTVVTPSPHGDFHYRLAVPRRSGQERIHEYATDEPLEPGAVVRLEGRFWLVAEIEPAAAEGEPALAHAVPARYRLRLRHPDGREELGAFRRYRLDAPALGHTFTTLEDGQPITWQVADAQLARDEQGAAYLDLVAERDYSEVEELPAHELEHTAARRDEEESLPAEVATALSQADEAGLAVEIVSLEPGEEPDWEEAERFIDSLVIEEVEDDVLELCGVDPDSDPPETWLDTVKERLRQDLEQFRSDIEGDHDEIEEWDFLGGRVFAAVGTEAQEADPLSGHGWMVRLVDSEALGAAGFERVRKADFAVP